MGAAIINTEAKFKFCGEPFWHIQIQDFFTEDTAKVMASEFPAYDNPAWFSYKQTGVQVKKACNHWYHFGPRTYRAIMVMLAPMIVTTYGQLRGCALVPDFGLWGGGWHTSANDGILVPHLDFSIHPKVGLQRKLSVVIYLTPDMEEEYGGHLGLYEGDAEKPGKLVKEIAPAFNTAIIFDSTENSWHGLSRPLTMPEGMTRNSLAIYYLTNPSPDAAERQKASFYAPTGPRLSSANEAQVPGTLPRYQDSRDWINGPKRVCA